MIYTVVEENTCTICKTLSPGRTVNGGFACDDCIRSFIVQNQLWAIDPIQRNVIVYREVAKTR